MKSKQIHFPFTLTNTHTKKSCWTDAKRFYRLSEFMFVFVSFFFFKLSSGSTYLSAVHAVLTLSMRKQHVGCAV